MFVVLCFLCVLCVPPLLFATQRTQSITASTRRNYYTNFLQSFFDSFLVVTDTQKNDPAIQPDRLQNIIYFFSSIIIASSLFLHQYCRCCQLSLIHKCHYCMMTDPLHRPKQIYRSVQAGGHQYSILLQTAALPRHLK